MKAITQVFTILLLTSAIFAVDLDIIDTVDSQWRYYRIHAEADYTMTNGTLDYPIWSIHFNVSGSQFAPNLTLSELFNAGATSGLLKRTSDFEYYAYFDDLKNFAGCLNYYNSDEGVNITQCRLNLQIRTWWEWFGGNVSFLLQIRHQTLQVYQHDYRYTIPNVRNISFISTSNYSLIGGVPTIYTSYHGFNVGKMQTMVIFPSARCDGSRTQDFYEGDSVNFELQARNGDEHYNWMNKPLWKTTVLQCGNTTTVNRTDFTFPNSSWSIDKCYSFAPCYSHYFVPDQTCNVGILITNADESIVFPYHVQGPIICHAPANISEPPVVQKSKVTSYVILPVLLAVAVAVVSVVVYKQMRS